MACHEEALAMLDTFGKMMYASGDEAEPLQKCRMFVAAAVNEQLKQMLQKAMVTAAQRKCEKIELIDIVFLFRRHHKQLNRMFQFLRSADLVRFLTLDLGISAPELATTSTKLTVDDPEDDIVLSEYGQVAQKMYVAISQWDATGEIRRLLKQSPKDEVKLSRIKRISERVDAMDSDSYKTFSEARLCSMVSVNGRRNKRIVLRFLKWLTYPNVTSDTILLLSYIVSEMVCTIVEGAINAREDEDSTHFCNESPVNCLQLRHYEQSLRKSRGYMERGNVLIGYF